ncbi:MAG: hypothetical protein OHK0015_53690 [Chloroflexi bacterium OHK40]
MLSVSRTARRIALALALTIAALALAPWARAGQEPTVEEVTFTDTVPFTISSGPAGCPQIESDISGVAEIHHRLRTITYPDGSRRIVDEGSSKGYATDEHGRRYRYRYENLAIVSVAPNGPLALVEMRDLFTLRGGGGANRIDASFHWLWTYQPTDPGDPYASFVFPPADNWIQLETRGDPLTCDPI